jgi:hypothetical protein
VSARLRRVNALLTQSVNGYAPSPAANSG